MPAARPLAAQETESGNDDPLKDRDKETEGRNDNLEKNKNATSQRA